MPLHPYRGNRPTIAADAWVAPSADLIGDVVVEAAASVWFNVTVRADMAPVRIGERSNVQDNCVIHTDTGEPTVIGKDVTLGHGAIVHSSVVGDNVLIGMGAVLVGGNRIGDGAVVGAGAVLPAGMEVPARKLVVGVPAKIVRDAVADDERWTVDAAKHYVELSKEYRTGRK
ncbi:MAG: gamma carbonic anhydrase family protein [Chloroflexi bacterium]|nr:MAG: gamma carbonic anhydrase family protein [Chloroflexota bacterium]